jgi:integration host factor subunit alpha
LLLLFKGSAPRALIDPVYTRHSHPAAAPKRMNGHAVVNEPLEVETQSISRGALTKEELQNLLFEKIGLSKRECREMVNAIFEEMRAALEAGDTVKLEGFGRFQPKERPKRWARNLKSGEKIPISERRVVTFHPSKKLTADIERQCPADKPPVRKRTS